MHIGIDLGGTNIAAGLVDESGAILRRISIPTQAREGADSVISGLSHVCDMLLEGMDSPPRSIGIGVPGTVNSGKGQVVFTPNLPLSGLNITQQLQEKYGCSVLLGNDANCAALGEAVSGCAKGAKTAVFITLGTGVGGGITIGSRLYTGLSGAAGEFGHMVITPRGRQCGCGRKGCWETYASATGLVSTTIEVIRSHPGSLIWTLCGGVEESIDGRLIFSAFRSGDAAARIAVDIYISHLAAGVINLINIFEPEIFCIAGGISNAWDCLSIPLEDAVNAEKYTRSSKDTPQTKIVKAALGEDAGLIGAAMLAGS